MATGKEQFFQCSLECVSTIRLAVCFPRSRGQFPCNDTVFAAGQDTVRVITVLERGEVDCTVFLVQLGQKLSTVASS